MDKAIQLAPDLAVYPLIRAQGYIAINQLDEALDDLDQLIKQYPQFPTPYVTRGFAFSKVPNLLTTLENYQEAANLDPYFAQAFFNLSIFYQSQGDANSALQFANRGIEAEPTFYRGYFLRGDLYLRLGNYDLALPDLDKAASLDPTRYQIYQERGILKVQQREFAAAIDDFNTALKLAPNDACRACLYYNLGIVYATLGDDDRAIMYYTQAIEIDPRYHDAYINRGNAYTRKGDLANANADYERARQLQ
jgi:tetratricopeptide (TPR) repeat protein